MWGKRRRIGGEKNARHRSTRSPRRTVPLRFEIHLTAWRQVVYPRSSNPKYAIQRPQGAVCHPCVEKTFAGIFHRARGKSRPIVVSPKCHADGDCESKINVPADDRNRHRWQYRHSPVAAGTGRTTSFDLGIDRRFRRKFTDDRGPTQRRVVVVTLPPPGNSEG